MANSIVKKKNISSKRTKSAQAKEMSPAKEYVLSIVRGFIIGSLALLIVFSIFSLVMVKFDYSEKYVPFMTIIASVISTYIGGYWSAKFINKKGLMVGVITSVPLAVLIIALAVMATNGSLNYMAAIAVVLMVIFGGIGGIMSVNRNPKRRKKYKK